MSSMRTITQVMRPPLGRHIPGPIRDTCKPCRAAMSSRLITLYRSTGDRTSCGSLHLLYDSLVLTVLGLVFSGRNWERGSGEDGSKQLSPQSRRFASASSDRLPARIFRIVPQGRCQASNNNVDFVISFTCPPSLLSASRLLR